MSEKGKEKDLSQTEKSESSEVSAEEWVREFTLEKFELAPVSSAELLKKSEDVLSLHEREKSQIDSEKDESGENAKIEDPIFEELAEPKLPNLARENRARLLMQSPNKIQFYWSIKHNPFQTLNRAFGGDTGSYTLVAKLINQKNDREEIFPVETEGSHWFEVDADSAYQAEIGFYAPNRPFVRVMFSNVLETPRKSPSPRAATDADWAISAREFADVLDSSGYAQDAFEVALAGDDHAISARATQNAFSQFLGGEETHSAQIDAEEIRFALLAIVSGYSLEDLRGQIGATLLAILQENADKLTVENALAALSEHFDVSMEEIEDEEEFVGDAVFGLSLVNFPRSSRNRRTSPKTLLPKLSSLPKIDSISSFGKRRF